MKNEEKVNDTLGGGHHYLELSLDTFEHFTIWSCRLLSGLFLGNETCTGLSLKVFLTIRGSEPTDGILGQSKLIYIK